MMLDHVRNVNITNEAHIKPMETLLDNVRLKWFGYCPRRNNTHNGSHQKSSIVLINESAEIAHNT